MKIIKRPQSVKWISGILLVYGLLGLLSIPGLMVGDLVDWLKSLGISIQVYAIYNIFSNVVFILCAILIYNGLSLGRFIILIFGPISIAAGYLIFRDMGFVLFEALVYVAMSWFLGAEVVLKFFRDVGES